MVLLAQQLALPTLLQSAGWGKFRVKEGEGKAKPEEGRASHKGAVCSRNVSKVPSDAERRVFVLLYRNERAVLLV